MFIYFRVNLQPGSHKKKYIYIYIYIYILPRQLFREVKNSVLNMLKILFISMVLTIQAHVQPTATSPCKLNSLLLCQCLCQKGIVTCFEMLSKTSMAFECSCCVYLC